MHVISTTPIGQSIVEALKLSTRRHGKKPGGEWPSFILPPHLIWYNVKEPLPSVCCSIIHTVPKGSYWKETNSLPPAERNCMRGKVFRTVV